MTAHCNATHRFYNHSLPLHQCNILFYHLRLNFSSEIAGLETNYQEILFLDKIVVTLSSLIR